MIEYASLFSAAFLSATLLPAQSELLLAALLASDGQPPWALIAVATTGNVLGSAVNWLIGRYCAHCRGRRRFPASQSADKPAAGGLARPLRRFPAAMYAVCALRRAVAKCVSSLGRWTSGERLAQAEAWYRAYGRWSLLLSWAPVIGDPLTVIAGVLREPFASFCCIVGIAKLGRYVAVAALYWQF